MFPSIIDRKPMTEPESKPASSAKADRSNARWVAAGTAMGIGSAALVAALLYTNRGKSEEKPKPKPAGPPPETD